MWFRVTGDNVYANYGWIAEGLYRTEEEIDKSAWYGSRPNIGDIKYRDLNGDGKIDWSDRARIGRNNRPAVTYGLTLNASWNGFDFNAQFTGGIWKHICVRKKVTTSMKCSTTITLSIATTL